jgi:hypothetical protein
MRCFECESSFVKSNAPVTFEVHGEPVIVGGIGHHVCEGCGNEMYRADMASRLQCPGHKEEGSNAADAVINDEHGMPFMQDYPCSQKSLWWALLGLNQ